MKGLAKNSHVLGEWLIRLLQLQFFWLVYTLKGGIIFGVFPATGTVFFVINKWFNRDLDRPVKAVDFKYYWKTNFKVLNQVGYLMMGILLIIWVDLKISQFFIQSFSLHALLVFLLILGMGTFLYLFPATVKYQLSAKNYLKQAFFLFISNLVETVAMFIGFFLVLMVVTFLPILLLFTGVPLFLVPVSWFAYLAIKKTELKQATI